jgi:hypothetical protein
MSVGVWANERSLRYARAALVVAVLGLGLAACAGPNAGYVSYAPYGYGPNYPYYYDPYYYGPSVGFDVWGGSRDWDHRDHDWRGGWDRGRGTWNRGAGEQRAFAGNDDRRGFAGRSAVTGGTVRGGGDMRSGGSGGAPMEGGHGGGGDRR